MSELILKEIEDIRVELSYTNDHLDNLVSRIKSFDKGWFESGCDTNIVFGLLGHKEHVDIKLNQLRLAIEKLNQGDNK
jgi:hypothetical protein